MWHPWIHCRGLLVPLTRSLPPSGGISLSPDPSRKGVSAFPHGGGGLYFLMGEIPAPPREEGPVSPGWGFLYLLPEVSLWSLMPGPCTHRSRYPLTQLPAVPSKGVPAPTVLAWPGLPWHRAHSWQPGWERKELWRLWGRGCTRRTGPVRAGAGSRARNRREFPPGPAHIPGNRDGSGCDGYGCEDAHASRSRFRGGAHLAIKGEGRATHGQTPGAGAAAMPLSQSRAGQSPCSSKACRNLFGPVDHEQLQQDFEDQMKQQLEEAQQRWNFNFETETPLEGPFKWERVLVAEQAPHEVHSLVRAVISSDSRSSLAHRVPPKERVGRICPEEAQQSSKVCRAGSLQGLKRGQTTIKDFYSAKRRIVPARPRP